MFNRNHIFMIGAVLLSSSAFSFAWSKLSCSTKRPRNSWPNGSAIKPEQSALTIPPIIPGAGAKKEVTPPNWVGWLMLSAGVVLVLHSMAMPKPGA